MSFQRKPKETRRRERAAMLLGLIPAGVALLLLLVTALTNR